MAKAKAVPEAVEKPGAAVVPKKGTAVSTALISMDQDAGSGFEGATKESFAIPFVGILQSGSPQCKKSDGACIEGATEGMFFNTATGEIIDGDEGFYFIPSAYTLTYVEWAPRETGGGYRGEHNSTAGLAMRQTCHKDVKGRDILPNGNALNATHNFYGILLGEDDSAQRVILSLTSTQIKTAKKWMTVMSLQEGTRDDGSKFPAPMFSNVFHLTTEPQSNDKGSWFGWTPTLNRRLDLAEKMDVALYLKARTFKDSILKGEIKTAERAAEPAAGAPAAHEDGEEF